MNEKKDPRRPRIVVCDDEPAARRGIVRALGREGYRLDECASGLELLHWLEGSVADLVLLDLRMPELDGMATLERLMASPAPPPVVVVTADSGLRTAVDAVRAGAADFLAKPYDIEELRWVVRRTLEGAKLRRENARLEREVERLGGGDQLLGESPPMRRLSVEIEQVAPSSASLLITGETGTGKELVARRVHQLSAVADGPFVALNCAAVPESLLESELFGHRKGAFTGADRDRAGRFQEAHGGTLFLDEIGDMPQAAQAKLLRVLQDGIIEPLGGGTPVAVEVRVLAATHRDLRQLGEEGTFRQDLYFRLRVVEMRLPPLRERGEDVLLLARAFLSAARRGECELSAAAARALLAHDWPGNVRELKNAMERAAIFCPHGPIAPQHLPAEIRGIDAASAPRGAAASALQEGELSFQQAKDEMIESFERAYFTELLGHHGGNVSQAARAAGLHRQSLQKMLRRLEIDPESFRADGSRGGEASSPRNSR